jgi:oxygen-independent coproporphyrinogen-3 oxidase
MLNEITILAHSFSDSPSFLVKTIYFGGVTPSLIPPNEIEKIIKALRKNFRVDLDCEITIEVNPGTISKNDLAQLFHLGINRLSIGVQSTNQKELRILERLHGYREACHTIKQAREVGFGNISIDLIYGLPDQNIGVWTKTLQDVLGLQPEHLSLYALTVEEGTPLALKVKAGTVPMPDPDLAADMYDMSREILSTEGYEHYEISNWALKKQNGIPKISKHNRHYWLNLPNIGIGAGAHGYIGEYRLENVSNPYLYIHQLKHETQTNFPFTPGTVNHTMIDKDREMGETMMMGLRLLTEGVSLPRFHDRFGLDMREVFSDELDRLLSMGLIHWGGKKDQSLFLSESAYLLANRVFIEFI